MATNYSPRIVTDGLIMYLDAASKKSYPGTGSTWTDISNNRNNGTLINNPTFSSNNNGILQFNGINQYVTSVITNTPFTQLTFIAFFYRITTGASGAGIVFNREGGGNVTGMNICYPNSNNLGYHWNDDSGTYLYDSGLSVPLNVWSYCALSVNSTSALFCVNGNFINRIYSHASTNIGAGLQIGADVPTNRYYQSNFASTYLYNRALTISEIAQNYNAIKGRFNL
jgi:type II secretory pathway pseudopilin PulG